MKHIHFKEIESTQNYLRQEVTTLMKEDNHVLVSVETQTHGIGRKENRWVDSSGSIAFSCVIPSSEKLSLVPLWTSLTVKDFFKKKFQIELQLKWPNDLYYKNKKCGGIICHKVDEVIVIGIGLNLSGKPDQLLDDLNQAGHLEISMNSLNQNFKEEIPLSIYQHILATPFVPEDIPNHFKDQCLFIGENVKISDDCDLTKGKFIGIGEWGEALVKDDTTSTIAKIYNGSMRKKD